MEKIISRAIREFVKINNKKPDLIFINPDDWQEFFNGGDEYRGIPFIAHTGIKRKSVRVEGN